MEDDDATEKRSRKWLQCADMKKQPILENGGSVSSVSSSSWKDTPINTSAQSRVATMAPLGKSLPSVPHYSLASNCFQSTFPKPISALSS